MIRLVAVVCLSACLPLVGPPSEADAAVGGGGGEVSAGGGGGADAGPGLGGGGGADAGVVPSCTDLLRNGTESDVDCGGACAPCANAASCRSALDCASGVCLGGRCAAPVNPCGTFAGCTTFTDLTTQAAVIHFPGGNDRYTPQCARVRFGQSVTFTGDFSSHPMESACWPSTLALHASSGGSLTVTFDQGLGAYGFFCTQHGSVSGAGMAGAIEVVR